MRKRVIVLFETVGTSDPDYYIDFYIERNSYMYADFIWYSLYSCC